MADIGEQLIVYLKTQSGVTTLTGIGTAARILQQTAPKESTLDATICITITDDQSIDYLGGSTPLRRADISVTGYASFIETRNSLAAAIDAAMDAITTSVGSIAVTEVVTNAGRSDGEWNELTGGDFRLYYSAFSYRIWYYSS